MIEIIYDHRMSLRDSAVRHFIIHKGTIILLSHALIICTSNYKSKDEVREKLGNPIFNRFDGVIRFTDLDSEAKIEIARKELDELDEEGTISENIRQNLLVNSTRLENAREIRRLIKDTKSLIEIRKICE